MMPTRIQPVIDWESKVVQVKLDERRLEVNGMAELLSKAISFKLKVSAEQRR